jgi:cob(I)alamin adenosyltransferase
MEHETGLVHVYTGCGKGKTTCSLGIALRAIGWGARVCMIQFIKGYSEIGEIKFADICKDNFVIKQFALDLTRGIGDDKSKSRQKEALKALKYASEIIKSAEFDVVILDEINNAIHFELITIDETLELIKNKPKKTELILTGRDAPQAIIDAADYVTEMTLLKHPFYEGVAARKKIDY